MDFFVVRSKFCCEFLSSIWQHLPPIDPIFICVDPIWIWIHNTGRNYSLLCYYFYALLRVHMLNHLRTEWRKNMIKKGKTELNVEVDLWIISWQVGKNLIQGMGVKCWKRYVSTWNPPPVHCPRCHLSNCLLLSWWTPPLPPPPPLWAAAKDSRCRPCSSEPFNKRKRTFYNF